MIGCLLVQSVRRLRWVRVRRGARLQRLQPRVPVRRDVGIRGHSSVFALIRGPFVRRILRRRAFRAGSPLGRITLIGNLPRGHARLSRAVPDVIRRSLHLFAGRLVQRLLLDDLFVEQRIRLREVCRLGLPLGSHRLPDLRQLAVELELHLGDLRGIRLPGELLVQLRPAVAHLLEPGVITLGLPGFLFRVALVVVGHPLLLGLPGVLLFLFDDRLAGGEFRKSRGFRIIGRLLVDLVIGELFLDGHPFLAQRDLKFQRCRLVFHASGQQSVDARLLAHQHRLLAQLLGDGDIFPEHLVGFFRERMFSGDLQFGSRVAIRVAVFSVCLLAFRVNFALARVVGELSALNVEGILGPDDGEFLFQLQLPRERLHLLLVSSSAGGGNQRVDFPEARSQRHGLALFCDHVRKLCSEFLCFRSVTLDADDGLETVREIMQRTAVSEVFDLVVQLARVIFKSRESRHWIRLHRDSEFPRILHSGAMHLAQLFVRMVNGLLIADDRCRRDGHACEARRARRADAEHVLQAAGFHAASAAESDVTQGHRLHGLRHAQVRGLIQLCRRGLLCLGARRSLCRRGLLCLGARRSLGRQHLCCFRGLDGALCHQSFASEHKGLRLAHFELLLVAERQREHLCFFAQRERLRLATRGFERGGFRESALDGLPLDEQRVDFLLARLLRVEARRRSRQRARAFVHPLHRGGIRFRRCSLLFQSGSRVVDHRRDLREVGGSSPRPLHAELQLQFIIAVAHALKPSELCARLVAARGGLRVGRGEEGGRGEHREKHDDEQQHRSGHEAASVLFVNHSVAGLMFAAK